MAKTNHPNPVSIDIKNLLATNGIGEFAGSDAWAIYIGREPQSPDDVVTIYDTGGIPFDNICEKLLDKFAFQIRVRGNSYLEVSQKILEISAFLNLTKNLLVTNDGGETLYQLIAVSTNPESIGYDENERNIWTANFNGMREFTPET